MQQLSAQDSSFIYLESPATPMHVGSISFYDVTDMPNHQLDEDAVLRAIDQRLHLAVATRRRVVRVPMEADYPYWIEDADFDLEYHVRRVAVPKPGDWETLNKLCARILSRPLDMSKPLWEMYIIEGLDQIDGVPAGGFALLTKTHHAAVDGASGVHFLALMHDLTATAARIPPPTSPWRPDPLPSDAELLLRSSFNHLTQPFRMAERLSQQFSQQWLGAARQFGTSQQLPSASNNFRRIPKTRFNGAVTPHRVIGSVEIALADIKQIRQAVEGATVNDVVLTICGGALRQYLLSKNELDEDSLIAMAPVNIRSAKDDPAAAGNRVSALFVGIGTDVEGPLERLETIYQETSASKVIHSAVDAGSMTDYGQFVPAFTAAMATRLMTETAANAPVPPFNVSITNVPGPQQPLYFCGARMLTTIGYGPITQGMGLIFPVFSYCGRLTLSFTSCREVLPDPEFFEDCIRQAFADLQHATQQTT